MNPFSRVRYPIGTVIGYGPDNKIATKLVASIFTRPGQQDPAAMEKWFVQGGDLRQDPAIMAEVAAFLKRHRVLNSTTYDRIFGCPHEETKDYPEGGVCPHCPFWANVDRYTHEPKSVDLPLTADQILAGLCVEREEQPLITLAAVERNRDLMIEPFLRAVERGVKDPGGTPPGDAMLFSYAMFFLAKWREQRACPLVIRWLSLPGEGAFEIGGDTVTEWGPRVLASVCGGDLEPVQQLILNRDANEFCRGAALDSLAVLLAWGELSRDNVEKRFLFLAREGLEREPSHAWSSLASACAEIEALSAFPEIHRAYADGLIDSFHMREHELDDIEAEERGRTFAGFVDRHPHITDVVRETRWWQCFHKRPPELEEAQPYIAAPKIGRNEPCPCGSGKKYKKCCGK